MNEPACSDAKRRGAKKKRDSRLRWKQHPRTRGAMAGAKLTPSPSEIDPDVKTEVQKTPEPIWINPSNSLRTVGSFGSDAGQR